MRIIRPLSALLPLLAAAVLLPQTACGPEFETADLSFEIRFMPGGQAYDQNDLYEINGTKVRLNVLRFYLSGIGLRDLDGNLVTTPEHILAEPAFTDYDAGTVIKQAYQGVVFDVGVQEEVNHADPGRQEVQGTSLEPQPENVHWGWNTGYIFIKINGEYDSDSDGVPDTDFQIHYGMDDYLAEVEMTANHGGDEVDDITIRLDYDPIALFDGVDFPAVNTTHVILPDEKEFCDAIFANTPGAFTLN